MNSSNRPIALRTAAALAFVAGCLMVPAAGQAKLLEPTFAGPLSNGSFSGLPIRADASASSARQPVEVVGENCYVVRRQTAGRDRADSRNEPVCE